MGDDAVWAALGEALAQHPDDALLLLRAVRDDSGAIVDFLHRWANARAESDAGELLTGRRVLEVYSAEDAFLLPLQRELVGSGGTYQGELTVPEEGRDERVRGRSYLLFMAAVGPDQLVCQYRDVTETRRTQELLEHRAGHDELTGLPNRRLLSEHLQHATARLERHDEPVVVLLCDLDGFKLVNDTHGHAAGDDLLRQVARRLRAAVRPQDVVARYGGDEFVILAEDVSEGDGESLVRRLSEGMAGSYLLDGGTVVDVGLSIGVALTRVPLPPDELLRRADRSLYAHKRRRGPSE